MATVFRERRSIVQDVIHCYNISSIRMRTRYSCLSQKAWDPPQICVNWQLKRNSMIWIAFTFVVGIALALVAIYEWRIALRIIAPIAVIIALLIGLIAHQSNNEKQYREAQRATQETHQESEKRAPRNSPPARTQGIKEESEEKLRLANERKSTAEAFLANNRSLIELYFNSASRCHSALIFTGKMEDDAHCQAAIKAKNELQQVTGSLAGISREDLKRVDSTTMWRIEYADSQMESAYQTSKRR